MSAAAAISVQVSVSSQEGNLLSGLVESPGSHGWVPHGHHLEAGGHGLSLLGERSSTGLGRH